MNFFASQPRRRFLAAAGISIGLPAFASLKPLHAGEEERKSGDAKKKRMVCIANMLGFYPEAFWPSIESSLGKGTLEEFSEYSFGRTAEALNPIRDQITLLSGLDHGLKGGHFAIHAFLSGVRQIDAKSMPMANITIDQYAAELVAGQTRFPSLTIGSESGIHGGCQLSWTRSGTRVPPIPGPQQLFEKLFVGTAPNQRSLAKQRFALQRSILDHVREGAADLKRKLNQQDKDKFDQYLTSIRDVEKRIGLRRNWVDIPKPQAPFDAPSNRNMVEDLPILYDLIVLALQTDSTRIATLEIGGDFNPRDLGINGGYHSLSHHGKRPEAIESLVQIETYQIEQYARFIKRLNEVEDENGSLLSQTSVLFGSGMGNANSHTNTNLPVVIAGSDFQHGRMLSYDQKSDHRPPLTNLFVSILQDFGIETDQFATSTGTLRGLV